MTYADLPAGHEIDRLIAERVMGWADEGDGWWHDGTPNLVADVDGVGAATPGNLTYEDAIFEPSKRIDHAWAVVARMKDDHVFRIENDQGEILEWIVEVECLGAVWSKHSASAETAPLAICRAALAAVAARNG